MKRALALILILCLSACAGALQWNSPEEGPAIEAPPSSYTVKPGDDVYAIAWRYGLDYRDVAAWNRLGRDYRIHPGETLVLRAPASAPRKPPVMPVTHASAAATPSGPVQWAWPVDGQVVREFHPGSRLAKGIDITAPRGTEVHAAAGGKVVYAGTGIVGYGKLLIVKNSETLLSAYADNDELLVKEGDNVRIGDRIAVMGVGRDERPVLHFEIRSDGNPVDPLSYLPKR